LFGKKAKKATMAGPPEDTSEKRRGTVITWDLYKNIEDRHFEADMNSLHIARGLHSSLNYAAYNNSNPSKKMVDLEF
jgi:hypothetical protein